VTERTPKTPTTPHTSHDRLLVVAGLDADMSTAERLRLERQLRDCADCRVLAAELAAISASIRSDLPQPRRPRDFRLSADQAARLRGSPISRLLERLAAPGFAALQPLAGVAMALGLTLIVLNSVSLPFGGSAAAPAALNADDRTVTAEGAPSAAPTLDVAGSLASAPPDRANQATPTIGEGTGGFVDTGATAQPIPGAATQPAPTATTGAILGPLDPSVTPQPSTDVRLTSESGEDRRAGPPAGIVAGLALFLTGAFVLLVRRLARRRAEAAD
jgi:hypothetical protein